MTSLLAKYRPSHLADVVGQAGVVRPLKLFVKTPYPCAMLFHGETGTGKSSCAWALAGELGCNLDDPYYGGVSEIASGEQTADSVRKTLEALRYRPWNATGWRVLIVNECDHMTQGAQMIWLDALENLPPQTVVVFTTNCPEKLSKRLRDRCENYAFTSEPAALKPAIRALARKVWKAEGCRGSPPALDTLGMPTLGDEESMHASIRLALQQLTRYVREAKAGGDLGRVRTQLAKDLLVISDEYLEVDCDHCGHTNKVGKGADRHTCEECGQQFTIEYD